jgi:hypothetical protein
MNLLQLIITLTPQIVSLIQMAEQAFPAQGAGVQKLNAVTNAVSSVVAAIPEVASQAEAIKTAVVPHVNALVAILNALRHPAPAQPPAA